MFVFVSLKNLVYLSIVWATFFTCHLFSSMPSSNASSQLVAEKLFKNELDEIHKKMSETDQLQDKLDNQMEEIVKKVEEAQNKIAEAKKESFEILKEDTEARARTLFDEVNKKMQEIKEIQDRVQGDLNEKFAETATATKVELTQLETLAAQLKAKIVEYQATQPDEENKAIQGGGQATQEVTQQKEQGQVAEPSIAESFLNLLSTIAARTIKGAKRIKEWITGLIDGGVKKKPEMVSEYAAASGYFGERVQNYGFGLYAAMPQMPVAPLSQQPVAAPRAQLIPGLMAQPKTILELRRSVQAYIDMFALMTKQFDQLRVSITQQHETVEVVARNVKNYLFTVDLIKNYLNSRRQQEEAAKPPYWKKVALYCVDKILDFGAGIVRIVVQGVKSFYNYFFAPFVQKFSSDVKNKLETMEEKKETPEKQLVPTTMAVPTSPQAPEVKQEVEQEEEEEEKGQENRTEQVNQMPQA